MFKKETLHCIMTKARILYVSYIGKTADEISISISKGNTKIGRVMNVSLMPVMTCGNCSGCAQICYDINDANRYPNVLDARVRNTILAKVFRDEFFNRIDLAMSRRRKNKLFRWHVGGDIMDADYFERMVKNAWNHPEFECIWTYTKMYGIVNEYVRTHGNDRHIAIPSNMVIMFSDWDGMPMDNPYNFPTFACKLADGNKDHPDSYFETLYKCPGNCDICKKAHRGCIAAEDTYADEH